MFADNEIEIFATEVTKIENSEATFTDISIECYFSRQGLGQVLNEQLKMAYQSFAKIYNYCVNL